MDGDEAQCTGWVVARTKPLQEAYAQENVQRQNYEAYLPLCIDSRTKRVSPLFPGYLFVNAPQQWLWLRSTYGILDVLLGTEFSPARLSARLIASIRARESKSGVVELPTERFAHGASVRITKGVFEGRLGLYAGQSNRERAKVLLELLGGKRSIVVQERHLELA